jgi:hypothetical protein
MSLAIYAAPFNDEFNNNNNNNNNNNDNDNVINKKRQIHNHNKTQKMYNTNTNNFDKNKVDSVLEEIHNNTEESISNMPNFSPPPKPQSSGVQKTVTNEAMQNMINQNNLNNMNMYKELGKAPTPNYEYDNGLELNSYRNNYGDNKSIDDYYKKMLPTMDGLMIPKNPVNKQYYNPVSEGNNMMGGAGGYGNLSSQDVLLQKLNYMINLLEEKQDERTNNVTEEVVLYSFLGIFIIFVIDSFARVGKYVR